MPEELFGEKYKFLPRNELLSFEEIERLVKIFVDLGVGKVRITGGEPLLRHDLVNLIERISSLPGVDDLAITSNATMLPRWAEPLAKAGLRRITVSLDSLDEQVFRSMNGNKLSPGRVLEGIEAAERAGFRSLKINCVAQKGVNDHTLVDLARRFRGTQHIVRFIEYMDVGTKNTWSLDEVVTGEQIAALIDAEFPLEPISANYPGEVAKRWRYRDGGGEIGIITSVSQPFCGECSRARLTTNGQLVTCLFATSGRDLRAPLRDGASDDELRDLVASIWGDRNDRYSEERGRGARGPSSVPEGERIEMYQIGG